MNGSSRGPGRLVRWGLVALLALLTTALQARQPVEHFARLPLFTGVTISPDGQRFAALATQGPDTRLITGHTGQRELKVALSTDNQDLRILWARWVNNERLVVSIAVSVTAGLVQGTDLRLLSVRFDGAAPVDLVRQARWVSRLRRQPDQVVDWLPEDGRHLLLQLPESSSGNQAVYRVDVETGDRVLVKAGEGKVWRWITDAQHRVRAALAGDDQTIELRVADPQGQAWRTLWSFKPRSPEAVWPLGFGADPQQLFIEAQHEGRAAVFTVDLADPALARKLVLAHPTYDVRGRLIRSRRGAEVVGLDDLGGDERSHWWHADWLAFAQELDRVLPGRRNQFLQTSANERRYLVHSSGGGTPGQYLLGDHDTGKLQLLADQYPQLRGVPLGRRQALRLHARDGLALEAFLTLPPGGPDRPRGPLVLLPHGGPSGQDRRGLDMWSAMLADRGIAVLQVNFRGSSGYGHDFMRAGLQQWGQAMQDDLEDAVKWAIDQEVADPKRVCIVGGSYGGYAALMGAVKSPQRFRCAASLNGVTDLVDLSESFARNRAAAEVIQEQLGHGWQDRERLRANSPVVQAGKIGLPVLLVAGSADRVVPVRHSREMDKALRSADKPVRYIEIAGADHGLSRNAHRLVWFEALAAFLDEHLADQPGKP